MEKYYTPNLEDIYYGYKMQWLQKANGNAFVLDGVDIDTWQNWDYHFQGYSVNGLRNMIADKRIRTKYLDKEDIESLGWKEMLTNNIDDNECVYRIGNVDLDYNLDIHWLHIADRIDYDKCFKGKCKSINELKKIMQWLNIK